MVDLTYLVAIFGYKLLNRASDKYSKQRVFRSGRFGTNSEGLTEVTVQELVACMYVLAEVHDLL